MTFKLSLLVCLLTLSFYGNAQGVVIDSCGVESSSILNQYEIIYFNNALPKYYLDVSEQDLALENKRILFLSGDTQQSKIEFFENYGKPWFIEGGYPSVQLITLTKKEIEQIEDYDAIIVSWYKISVHDKKVRKRIIDRAMEAVHKKH